MCIAITRVPAAPRNLSAAAGTLIQTGHKAVSALKQE